jgi:hypothetical protein
LDPLACPLSAGVAWRKKEQALANLHGAWLLFDSLSPSSTNLSAFDFILQSFPTVITRLDIFLKVTGKFVRTSP